MSWRYWHSTRFHLACFTTGLSARKLAAEVTTFVPGRRVDDMWQVMLRFSGGAKAGLGVEIAVGNENNLTLRVYGEKGGLAWSQENPNYLVFTVLKEQPRMITRGGLVSERCHARHANPSGHPEGYFEAFAQLYKDIADQIAARILKQEAPEASCLVPSVSDGVGRDAVIDAVLRSAKKMALHGQRSIADTEPCGLISC